VWKSAFLVTVFAAIAVTTAPASPSQPHFAGCVSFVSATATGRVRPASIVLACADANFYVDKIRWSNWGPRSATGLGTGHQNDCTPYCAAGKFHAYPLSIRLDILELCGTAHRTAEFTRASWRFVAARPHGIPRSGSERFRCSKP
jgi:hypothetical protein